VANTRLGPQAILAPAARRDIKGILRWSEEKFGKEAALRYEALLVQALRDIEADAARPGVSQRPDLPASVFLYQLAFSRNRVSGEPVKEPRHLLAFRRTASRLEVLRVLHDRRDLSRHLLRE
jgi:plasmid stabilization system protein ParE